MSRGGQMRSSKTIYVRGIPDRIRHDDLKRVFTKYGKVLDITIPVDYYSGLSKGFCFIEYDDIRDAEEAQYRMDRSRVFGREIDVEFSRGHRKTPGEMRNRDRGSDRDRRYGGSDRGGYRGGRSRSRSRSRTRSRTRSPPPPSRYESSRSHHRSERRRTRSRSNGPNGHHHHMADRPAPVSNGDRGTHYRSKSHSISPRPLRKRSRSGSLRSDKINQSRSRTRSPSQ